MIKFTFAQNIDSLILIVQNQQKADIYNEISFLYREIDVELSKSYADTALFFAEKEKSNIEISKAYVNIAKIFYFKSNLDSSLFYYKKSYEIISKTDDKYETAKILNNLGLVYENKSDYELASECFIKAIKLYEEINSLSGIAETYNNFGILYYHLKNHQKSVEYFNKSLEIHEKLNEKTGQANVLNNLAGEYFEQKNYTQAINYTRKSLELWIELEIDLGVAFALGNLANIYIEVEKFDSAYFYMDQALVIYEKNENNHGIANIYHKKGQILYSTNNYKKALASFEKSLIYRNKAGEPLLKYETLLSISKTYKKLNDFEQALLYYERYTNLKDSIFNEDMNKNISELQIKYETEKKDKEIKLLEKNIKIKETKRQFLYLIIAVLLAFTVLVSLLLYFRSKLHKQKVIAYEKEKQVNSLFMKNIESENRSLEMLRQKEDAEILLLKEQLETKHKIDKLQKEKYLNEIKHKNNELQSLTMNTITLNKKLIELKREFLKNAKNSSGKQQVAEFVKQINSSLNADHDWKTFRLHFEDIHSGFFHRLLEKYPKLSENEIRLCSYMRTGLSSKETAEILNVSLSAINKNRQRLRKKLNITSEINLNDFMKNI